MRRLVILLIIASMAVSPIASALSAYPPWFTVYGGTEWDIATGITVPNPNNIIVVGSTNSTTGPGDNSDAVISGLTGGGVLAWTRVIDAGSTDFLSHVVTGPGGLVYAVGSSNVSAGPLTNMDLLLAVYTQSGGLVWASTVGAPFPEQEIGYDIYVNSSGFIHVAGVELDLTTMESDVMVAVFYPNGSLAWAIEVGEPGINETGFGVIAGPDGSVYVVGATNTTPRLPLGMTGSGDEDMLIMKVYPNATLAWSTVIDLSIVDFAFKAVLDPSGVLYVVGEAREDIFGNDVIVARINGSTGAVDWVKRVDYWRFDEGFDIYLHNGELYIAGAGYPIYPFKNLYEIYIISMALNGSLTGFTTIGGPDMDQATSIHVYDGGVYAAGFTLSYGSGQADFVALHLGYGIDSYTWCTGENWASVSVSIVGNATVSDAVYRLLPYDPVVEPLTLSASGAPIDRVWTPSSHLACPPGYAWLVGGEAYVSSSSSYHLYLLAAAVLLAASYTIRRLS